MLHLPQNGTIGFEPWPSDGIGVGVEAGLRMASGCSMLNQAAFAFSSVGVCCSTKQWALGKVCLVRALGYPRLLQQGPHTHTHTHSRTDTLTRFQMSPTQQNGLGYNGYNRTLIVWLIPLATIRLARDYGCEHFTSASGEGAIMKRAA